MSKLLEELNAFEAVKVMRKKDIPTTYRKGQEGSRSVSETGFRRAQENGEQNDLRSSKETIALQKQKDKLNKSNSSLKTAKMLKSSH